MDEPLSNARPLVWTALRPVGIDCNKLRHALADLQQKDTTFSVDDEDADGQVILRAMSELHLDNICERLARNYEVYVDSDAPTIIYLETIRDASMAEAKFIRQSEGAGHYAHIVLRIEPNPTKGYELVSEITDGAIPAKYLDPIDQGIKYALKFGLEGHEMTDVKVTLSDGSYHETDSDEEAFENAAFNAMKEAMRQSGGILLEPVVSVEVTVPQEWAGSVIADFHSRRADVTALECQDNGHQMVRAIGRLVDIVGYADELLSKTNEHAAYSTTLLRYRRVEDPGGDDRIGVTANKPQKPKPRRRAEAVEQPLPEVDW